eukprot:6479196-Amphidinium_carterae.1
MGWARDSGRSHGYDVREVLGSTGIPGQNGWKERPRLPRVWPPSQLVKAKGKGQTGADVSKVPGAKRPYPFGPIARQLREAQQRSDAQRATKAKNTVESKTGKAGRNEMRGQSVPRQSAPRSGKRDNESQSDCSEHSARDLQCTRSGTRRVEIAHHDQKERSDEDHTAENSRAFRLIPAQDVPKEAKGRKGDRSSKRWDSSEGRAQRPKFSLKEK